MELEELQCAYLKLQEDYKTAVAEKSSFEEKTKLLEEEKLKLQNTNHELFLRVTSPAPKQEDNQGEKTVTTDEIVDIYKKEHNIKW